MPAGIFCRERNAAEKETQKLSVTFDARSDKIK